MFSMEIQTVFIEVSGVFCFMNILVSQYLQYYETQQLDVKVNKPFCKYPICNTIKESDEFKENLKL